MMDNKNQKQQLSASQIQERMRKIFKKAGIPYTTNQRQSGTASIHFVKKANTKKGEEK